jgi:hypothetical protein
VTDAPIPSPHPVGPALSRDIAQARDPQIMRIVAMVDAMTNRGSADHLVAPLRRRLAVLRPPRPLRFVRLIVHPLALLIVPAARWRFGQPAIPRTAIMPMAEHVRLAMGPAATEIEAEIRGHTDADTDLIARLGRSLWPAAADILAGAAIPETWGTTALGEAMYRPLADVMAALLHEAAALDTLCAATATGLLPPEPEAIAAILIRVAKANLTTLPMMIALLLGRLPQAAGLLPQMHSRAEAAAMDAAVDQAADILLRQFDQKGGTDTCIARGALSDAGASTRRFATLLDHLEAADPKPQQRARLRSMRRRLDADCKARFVSGLQDEFLTPLQDLGSTVSPQDVTTLEAAARGLRMLETEARAIGSGSTYDLLLGKAAEAIKDGAMRDTLTPIDRLRLVEILAGPEAALAMLDEPAD